MSSNSACTTPLSRIVESTWRRLCRSPFLALVISFSANGRSTRALASVVVIRPCSKRLVARFATISLWCAAPPPRRGPFLGVGMVLLDSSGPCQVPGQSGTVGGSVLLVFDEAVVVVVVRRQGSLRVEARSAVLERETHLVQLGLDLVDRLGTEVADVEQILLRAGDQLTHGVDALALEAVVRADGELQVFDRQGQVGGQLLVDRRRADVDALGPDVELPGQAEELHERLAGRGDRVAGTDRGLGLDVDDELVEVGALLDTGGLDLVG